MATKSIKKSEIPKYVSLVTSTLENAGFEAYIVGGCVRDLLLGREPKDWDVTTNAKPEEIIPLFDKTVYENKYGTVRVIFESVSHETAKNVSRETKDDVSYETQIVEVTPYRLESNYSDSRHPDTVNFSQKIEDDLGRRDFTVNAMAYSISNGHLIDIYKGQEHLADKLLQTVGNPNDRFNEDALRILRAIRFSVQLGFTISNETSQAILGNAQKIKLVSWERIRDEFTKIIDSENPAAGVDMLERFGLLKYIIPELEEGIGCEQGGVHIYDVYQHLLHALNHAAEKKFTTAIRIAALFHDIGKPRSRRPGEKKAYTFYGHEVIGARMAQKIMERLKYPKDLSELVVKFVRYHMFFSDTETITLSAVRRTIVNVGREHIWELMNIRECDRVGMKKKEAPYRLRKYHAMIEEALRAPTSVGMLKINGEVLIKELDIKPGRRMGWILHALLEEALVDPEKNTTTYLKSRALELDALTDVDLKEKGEAGKIAKEETEEEELAKIRGKHGVN